jgi:hypothetical protein
MVAVLLSANPVSCRLSWSPADQLRTARGRRPGSVETVLVARVPHRSAGADIACEIMVGRDEGG